VEQPREFPLELLIGLREELAELRATVAHLSADVTDLRQEVRADIRRVDGRLFQLMLAQLATFATAFGSLVAALAA
jgi:hypothetical protein